ncbi:SUN domain-containing protein 3-like [Pelecanus crispus]|uniref:SUN domain-containing protein 3-like n=1 Tax=Pelecanus crispus TaxID=36300 RepID=UPI003F5D06DE
MFIDSWVVGTTPHPPEGQECPEAPSPAASRPVGNSQAWLEQKMRELEETVAQVSAARGNILQAVREVLVDHGVQAEKREEILHLTQVAIKKVLENYLQMPDWALEAIGATIDEERTSKSYGEQGKKTWWLFPFAFSSGNPPETILQPRIAPGNCWAFQGSRGHVVIRLPEQIWPKAFTIWHISEAVSPSGEVSSAPKDFAVSGVDEATAETLLGTFTYDVHKEIAQTFHVQKELPRTFRYIKFQVQSNWGNPEYTCVYRVQVHGNMDPEFHQGMITAAQAATSLDLSIYFFHACKQQVW